jgi:hypothetical protein
VPPVSESSGGEIRSCCHVAKDHRDATGSRNSEFEVERVLDGVAAAGIENDGPQLPCFGKLRRVSEGFRGLRGASDGFGRFRSASESFGGLPCVGGSIEETDSEVAVKKGHRIFYFQVLNLKKTRLVSSRGLVVKAEDS